MKNIASHLLHVTCQVHLKAEEVKSFLKERRTPPSAPDSMSQGQRQHSAPRGVSPGPHSYPSECLLPGSPTSILSQLNSPRWPFTLTCSAHILTLGKVMPPLNRAPSHSVIWLFPSLRPTDCLQDVSCKCKTQDIKQLYIMLLHNQGEKKKKDWIQMHLNFGSSLDHEITINFRFDFLGTLITHIFHKHTVFSQSKQYCESFFRVLFISFDFMSFPITQNSSLIQGPSPLSHTPVP